MLRKQIALTLVWALSLVIVAAIARAQAPAQRGATPAFISGNDLGFRVERQRGDRVIGTDACWYITLASLSSRRIPARSSTDFAASNFS